MGLVPSLSEILDPLQLHEIDKSLVRKGSSAWDISLSMVLHRRQHESGTDPELLLGGGANP